MIHLKCSPGFNLVLLLALASVRTVCADAGWNRDVINWVSYERGLALAAEQKKPIMLVFHSSGCGACDDYSKLFYESRVIKASHALVMILVDDGEKEELSIKYSPDGSYVPRTYFLTPDGSPLSIRIGKPDSRFQYYLGSQGAEVLVEFMQQALLTSK